MMNVFKTALCLALFSYQSASIAQDHGVTLTWIYEPVRILHNPGAYTWPAAVVFEWNGFQGSNLYYIQKIEIKRQLGHETQELVFWEVFPHPSLEEPLSPLETDYIRDPWRYVSGDEDRLGQVGMEQVTQSEGYLIKASPETLKYLRSWKMIPESAGSSVTLTSPWAMIKERGAEMIAGPLAGRKIHLSWDQNGKTRLESSSARELSSR